MPERDASFSQSVADRRSVTARNKLTGTAENVFYAQQFPGKEQAWQWLEAVKLPKSRFKPSESSLILHGTFDQSDEINDAVRVPIKKGSEVLVKAVLDGTVFTAGGLTYVTVWLNIQFEPEEAGSNLNLEGAVLSA